MDIILVVLDPTLESVSIAKIIIHLQKLVHRVHVPYFFYYSLQTDN